MFVILAVVLATSAIADTAKLNQIKFSGYIQARYESDETSTDGVDANGNSTNKDRFDVRRARIKLTANPSIRTLLVYQADLTDDVTTKDAYLGYIIGDSQDIAATFLLGQMKWPFGWEIIESSAVRETPERSIVIQKLFPGERDKGAMFSSPLSDRFRWEAGLFNGTGANTDDNNSVKDFVGRLRYKVNSRLNAGVSGYFGKTFVPPANPPGLGTNVDKNRYGADFQYYLRTATVKAEWIFGKNDETDSQGGYLQLAQNFGPKYTGVVKYDTYDPNTDASGDRMTIWHLGVIRYLDEKTKVKFFYEPNTQNGAQPNNDIFRVEIISIF